MRWRPTPTASTARARWRVLSSILTRSPVRRARGIDPWASLNGNDGHTFFEALGDQIVTGANAYQRQ